VEEGAGSSKKEPGYSLGKLPLGRLFLKLFAKLRLTKKDLNYGSAMKAKSLAVRVPFKIFKGKDSQVGKH